MFSVVALVAILVVEALVAWWDAGRPLRRRTAKPWRRRGTGPGNTR
jgi:hypothetical protein